uniref:Uncharacterized protein n=1 Tax=Picea glauca TaxID=3330 RepID=A0A124GMU1_PICGL|nr:hypothetical protein ABT39_MTgene1443 [Picea glauca]QHR92423.1 hypothetical protein Q903MT_gene6469 [Picea sitchensis]
MALNKVFHKAPKDSHYRCHYAYPVGQSMYSSSRFMALIIQNTNAPFLQTDRTYLT